MFGVIIAFGKTAIVVDFGHHRHGLADKIGGNPSSVAPVEAVSILETFADTLLDQRQSHGNVPAAVNAIADQMHLKIAVKVVNPKDLPVDVSKLIRFRSSMMEVPVPKCDLLRSLRKLL